MINRIVISALFGAVLWGATDDSPTPQQPVPAGKPDENSDLDRIPTAPSQTASSDPKPAASTGANERIYLEDAFILSPQQGGLIVPSPVLNAPTWQERLFLDVRQTWKLIDQLSFTLSDRFNFRGEGDISFPNHENVFNEFREAYLSWQPLDSFYIDAGRINLRSGAALGFNPTDFFKTRAVEEPLSNDPSVLREDRLGALMLETQYIGQGRSLTIALAPAVTRPSAIYSATNLPTLNPSFDRTNDHYRLLVKGSVTFGQDFSPEFLFYREGSRNKIGANLTRGFGQRIVAYVEWAGGERSNVIDEALRYGRQTGTLPVTSPNYIPDDTRVRFDNDISTGASYTTSAKVTFNLEYHYHEAGFSAQDWNNWFAAGQGQSASSPIAKELWYIRSYAVDQQEPLATNSTFLRADWVDAFVPNLELTGFINTDIHDGSSLVQVSADYYLSNKWTIGAQVSANLGSKRSDFGSLPQSVGILLKLARYF